MVGKNDMIGPTLSKIRGLGWGWQWGQEESVGQTVILIGEPTDWPRHGEEGTPLWDEGRGNGRGPLGLMCGRGLDGIKGGTGCDGM